MKLVIPVSKHDRHLIPDFISAIEKFPAGGDHDLLVIGSKENEEVIISLEKKIKHLFKSSEIHIIDDTMLGWPMSCNFYFQQTCIHLRNDKETDAFFWFELDTVPLRKNWLDIISLEYYADTTRAVKEKREPLIYLGVKERVYEGKNGELLPESVAGNKMAQVGVYSTKICFAPVLNSLSVSNRHWTNIIQWYVVKHMIESNLIQNNWRTEKYRYNNGKLICNSISNLAWDVHWNNSVSSDAVLVHGCKDGSLVKLLLNNTNKEDMKVAKNLTVEEAKDVAEDIEDINETDLDRKMRVNQKRIANLKFFQKKPLKEENNER
jgi:hypothetical protein